MTGSLIFQRSPFLNRTQALLQAAQRREVKERGNRSLSTTKIKDEVQSVAQECRQWDIPLLSVKTAQNSVAKLVKKYHPEGVVPSTSEKKVCEVVYKKMVLIENKKNRHINIQGEVNVWVKSAIIEAEKVVFPLVKKVGL